MTAPHLYPYGAPLVPTREWATSKYMVRLSPPPGNTEEASPPKEYQKASV